MTALVQAGACPYASDSLWWTRLIVDAVNGDEVAVTELVAAAEELTRRLSQTAIPHAPPCSWPSSPPTIVGASS